MKKENISTIVLFANLVLSLRIVVITLAGGLNRDMLLMMLLSIIFSAILIVYGLILISKRIISKGFTTLIISYLSFLYVGLFYLDETGIDSLLFIKVSDTYILTILMWSPVVVIPLLIIMARIFSKKELMVPNTN
jgi:hypothetical protein